MVKISPISGTVQVRNWFHFNDVDTIFLELQTDYVGPHALLANKRVLLTARFAPKQNVERHAAQNRTCKRKSSVRRIMRSILKCMRSLYTRTIVKPAICQILARACSRVGNWPIIIVCTILLVSCIL